MSYPIETNVPVPPRMGRTRKYPFDHLRTGQSFEVPGKTTGDLAACVRLATRRTGFTFRSAKTDLGVRVWRVK